MEFKASQVYNGHSFLVSSSIFLARSLMPWRKNTAIATPRINNAVKTPPSCPKIKRTMAKIMAAAAVKYVFFPLSKFIVIYFTLIAANINLKLKKLTLALFVIF